MENQNLGCFDTYLEQTLLGGILTDPVKLDEIPDLKPEHFYHIAHQQLYSKMIGLYKENPAKLSLEGVAVYLKEMGLTVEEVYNWIAGVTTTAAPVIKHSAELIIGYYHGRKAAEIGHKLAGIRHKTKPEEIAEMVNEAQSGLMAITESQLKDDESSDIKDIMFDIDEYLSDVAKSEREILGLSTGLRDLDRALSGLQGNQLIILAARPSMGKTAFALNIARAVGVQQKKPCIIFSLETSKRSMGLRLLSAEAHIDGKRLKLGRLGPEDWEKYTMARAAFHEAPIRIEDKDVVTVSSIRALCRKYMKHYGELGCVIIDYLQLIQGEGRSDNRVQEVAKISRELKLMAKEFNIPVIALSQLSRGVEQRENKRPLMSDLRDSGSIEQDADVVLFLYRDDYYNPESERKNIVEIIIGKQRDGMTGTIEALYLREYNKFLDLSIR